MDIINYAETPPDQAAEQNLSHRLADMPNAPQGQAKSCPLCRTLNHLLSRECFNCGWSGAFCSSDASASHEPLFGRTLLLVKPPSLRSRWQTLKNWLFFIGSHRYTDTLKRN